MLRGRRKSSSAPHPNCFHTFVPAFTAMNHVFTISLLYNPIMPARPWNKSAVRVTRGERVFVYFHVYSVGGEGGRCHRQASSVNYLKGAVHESFVQVDDDTVLAVVRYADFRQEELGWWLQRQRALLKSWDLLEGTVTKHARTLAHTLVLKVWRWPGKSAKRNFSLNYFCNSFETADRRATLTHKCSQASAHPNYSSGITELCCWGLCALTVGVRAVIFCITSCWLSSVTVLPSGSQREKKRNTNVLCQAGPGLQTGRWCGHRQRARTHTHAELYEGDEQDVYTRAPV